MPICLPLRGYLAIMKSGFLCSNSWMSCEIFRMKPFLLMSYFNYFRSGMGDDYQTRFAELTVSQRFG